MIKKLQKLYDENGVLEVASCGYVSFTKEEAQEILNTKNPNRPFSKSNCLGYMELMNSGGWRKDEATPIRFDNDGHMGDGTHRMQAFVWSNLKEMHFNVVINVSKETFLRAVDSGKARTPKDRLQMLLHSSDNPRKLNVIESRMLSYMFVYNPNRKSWGLSNLKLSIQAMEQIYQDKECRAAIENTLRIFDELEVPPDQKSVPPVWAALARAYPYFQKDDRLPEFERLCALIFNPRTNSENSWDGWGKLILPIVNAKVVSKKASKGSSSIIREKLASTISYMIWKFYNKQLCPEDYIVKMVAKSREYFPFENEGQSIMLDQEKSNSSSNKFYSKRKAKVSC